MIRRLGFLSALAVALLGGESTATAGTLDQQQTTSSTDIGLVTNQSGGQTFTAGASGVLDRAELDLLKVGTPPATVTVEVRTTAEGGPTATVLSTGSIPSSAIGTNHGFVGVTFSSPAAVTAGSLYTLVAYTPGSFGNTVGWRYLGAGDPYPRGDLFLNLDPIPPGSADWVEGEDGDDDFAFKTYVAPAPPATNPTTNPGQTTTRKKCKQRKKKHRSAAAAKKRGCHKKKKRR
jgi:hypothetical protein